MVEKIEPFLKVLTLDSDAENIINYANACLIGGNPNITVLASAILNYKASRKLVKVAWVSAIATIFLVIATIALVLTAIIPLLK